MAGQEEVDFKQKYRSLKRKLRFLIYVSIEYVIVNNTMVLSYKKEHTHTHTHTPTHLPGLAFKVRTQYTHVCIVCSSRHSKRGQICV